MSADYKDTVLVVDDLEINRLILREMLGNTYRIIEAVDGYEAISQLLYDECRPSVILLDIMMPEMDGHEVLQIIKSTPAVCEIPVIFITAADAATNEIRGLSEGAADYIEKPFSPEVVKLRVRHQIELMHFRTRMSNLVQEKADKLISMRDHIMETMATMIECRNLESGQHVRRTSILTSILVSHLLTKPEYSRELLSQDYTTMLKAVPLHDIGKIGIPDHILLKPGRLTEEEFEVIKTHTTIGSDIIERLADDEDEIYLKHCHNICRHHHERWDGSGYPDGLLGQQIPLSARIVAIVDVYDALTSPRIYKEPISHERAMEIITKGTGTQFDPGIIKGLLEIENRFRAVDAGLLEKDYGVLNPEE